MTRRPLSAVADRATRLRRRLRHVASERGETLIESLVSIGIVGLVVVALIGAVTLSGSLTTILRAQSASQSAGLSVYEAVSSFTVPKSTPLYSNGACNSAVTNQLKAVAQAAATSNSGVTLDSAGITFGLAVVSVDSSGNKIQTVYPCTALAGHPLASAGEAATALQVSLPVTAVGRTTVDKGNGNIVRQDATFQSVLKANVYQGVT